MKTYELIVLTLFHSDKGMITGRTLLQKTLYFLNEKLQQELDFIPHYYGPYSAEAAEVISSLKANGIVEEKIETLTPFNFNVTFEPRLYIYQLTKIGKEIASLIESRQKVKARELKKTLEKMKEHGATDDYRTLSIAAKMYHILAIEEKPMSTQEIFEEARVLNWKIDRTEAEAAIKFLNSMGLINFQKSERVKD